MAPHEVERLVEEARRLVPKIARMYLGRGLAFDDLVGAGNLGVVEAAYHFEPSRGVKFGSYACWWIRKSIFAAFENAVSVVAVPLYSRQRRFRVLHALATSASEGREITTSKLAAGLGMSVRQVERALSSTIGTVSLEAPLAPGDRRRVEDQLSRPTHEGPEAVFFEGARARVVRTALEALSARDRLVLRLRFGFGTDGADPVSLAEISRVLGLSRERVRQIERSALNKLRRRLAKAGLLGDGPRRPSSSSSAPS